MIRIKPSTSTRQYLKKVPDQKIFEFLKDVPQRPTKKDSSIYKSLWASLDWSRIKSLAFEKQVEIYQLQKTKPGDPQIFKLQNDIIRNPLCKLLAVRRVSHESQGKRTAGIDGIRALNERQKLALSTVLQLDGNTQPIRRIYIAKPGTSEKRPLGIPTLEDRAKQALAKLSLEPEWEAKFEATSFGFRPRKESS